METEKIKKTTENKMNKAIDALQSSFSKIRTGRAHTGVLDQVLIDYHGTMTPINQLSNITLLDSRTISVVPWEKPLIGQIEKAILEADLGLNPSSVGELIRVPMPPLSEERRKELSKLAKSVSEDSKVSIRNIRREANELSKKSLKSKEISSDEDKKSQEIIQKLTDEFIKKIDVMFYEKEKEILTV